MFANSSLSPCQHAKRAGYSETQWEWASKNMSEKGTSQSQLSNCKRQTPPLRKSHRSRDTKARRLSRGGSKSCFSPQPWNLGPCGRRKAAQENVFWLYLGPLPRALDLGDVGHGAMEMAVCFNVGKGRVLVARTRDALSACSGVRNASFHIWTIHVVLAFHDRRCAQEQR